MRELVEPQTRKVFEGEACRVEVEQNGDRVLVSVQWIDHENVQMVATPDSFAALSRDLAAVNERVQEFARELVREPVGAVKA